MKSIIVIVAAVAIFTAGPAMAAEKSVSIDGIALRENVISLDHEWMGPGHVSTNLKLALGKQKVEDADMSLLGLAIGKRGYISSPEYPAVSLYAGGYLYGQTVSASVLEMSEDQAQPSAQVPVSQTPRFTERRSSVGLMSDLGLKFRAAKNLTLEVGPEVTVPFVIHRSNSDGQSETQRFPSIATNWRLGLGYTW
jgi:hypothetical protein